MKRDGRRWEELCKRCGRCCLEKTTQADGTIVVQTDYCRFLDKASKLCRVYEVRFQACRDCLPVSPENLAELIWLPEDCGYVEHFNRLHGQTPWRREGRVVWPEEVA
jgi:uncharacterized cysteine cluster protein YcgN (CxxCxxCC family)